MRPTSSWADNGWEGTSGRLRYDIEFMKAPKINFTLHDEPFDYRLGYLSFFRTASLKRIGMHIELNTLTFGLTMLL